MTPSEEYHRLVIELREAAYSEGFVAKELDCGLSTEEALKAAEWLRKAAEAALDEHVQIMVTR